MLMASSVEELRNLLSPEALGLRVVVFASVKLSAHGRSALPEFEEAVKRQLKTVRRKLVRRRHIWGIGAAWIITVPAAGALSALLFFALRFVAG